MAGFNICGALKLKLNYFDMNTVITDHAFDRAKDRLGLNRTALERLSELAYSNGIAHKDTKARLNRYITSLYMKEGSANNIKIYGEVIFIFKNNLLVTLYQIPNELKKYVKIQSHV